MNYLRDYCVYMRLRYANDLLDLLETVLLFSTDFSHTSTVDPDTMP